MAYHSKKKWLEFSPGVQELRWVLTVWLEGLLGRDITPYAGSDTVVYEPYHWSKYKLIPYDEASMPPVAGLGEGVLVCVDQKEYEMRFREQLFGHTTSFVPWHTEALPYEVGRGFRVYRVVAFPVAQPWAERRTVLSNLARTIRVLEQNQ